MTSRASTWIGRRVRSHYRAPWVGVVVDAVDRRGIAPLLTVRRTHDRHGNPVRARKVYLHRLSALWCERLD